MRVGILTFHKAINAGAVMQAYALQETLIKEGYDAFVVDYRPKYIDNAYSPIRNLNVRHPRGCIYELWSSLFRYNRIRRYEKFINRYLKLADFRSLNEFDYAILGSDQIWNPRITGGRFDPMFFNQHPSLHAKKGISYAASTMSVSRLGEEDINDFRKWLPKLTAIGVREQGYGAFIDEKIGVKSHEVIDPTLLADREIFAQMITKPKIDGKYLLFYEVWHNDDVENKARKMAKDMGLKFVGICGADIRMPRRNIIQLYSPDEFVSLIANASYVVTSSFHGTAFALIFEKQFNVVCEEPHQAVRMQELLALIGYPDKLTFKSEDTSSREIDYSQVNNILSLKRQESLKFIKEHIL